MPYCKNCNKEISKFDSDICPFCGCENPIADDYQTMDITRNISKQNPSYQLYKSKSKKVYLILCFALGFLGIHHLYIGFKKKCLINFLVSLCIYAIERFTLYFLVFHSFYSDVVAGLTIFALFNLIQGTLCAVQDSTKDFNGEFLR